jgi:hypothetical protein
MSARTGWIFAFLLVTACGDETAPDPTDDESSDEPEVPTGSKKDASVKRDASTKDAGRKQDAATASDDQDDTEDDTSDDEQDASADQEPADAGAVEPKDAGKQDAGKADAGKADAGRADAGSADAGGGAASCDTLTYDSFGKAFLTKYCVSCHGTTIAQAMVRLDTLPGVTAAKAQAKKEVSSGAMPPLGAKPTADEKTKFGSWIDCGPK